MAIIEAIPGLEVSVDVNGERAQEYDDADGLEEDVSTRRARYRRFVYIESKSDALFSVKLRLPNTIRLSTPSNALAYKIYVDGANKAYYTHFLNGGLDRPHVIDGAHDMDPATGQVLLKKFKFAPVTTVDDADAARVRNDVQAAKNLGAIQVRFYRVNAETTPHDIRVHVSVPDGSSELAEKALKGRAISHKASHVNGGYVRPPKAVNITKQIDKEPLAVFNFKYRSREALRSELVIPRSLSPNPVERTSPDRIRGAGDVQETLASREPAIVKREQKPRIKREVDEVRDFTAIRSERQWKYVKLENGTRAVDLTDDD
ncbi:hypothetical protein SODALDRAFT_34841 [Sodiomyces alkalinus F11]|uniref:DUF7918 domain-containing protein n=1 Tax=Sodiomyces alkalinus (strain CBS 110278 / VKM F-3762 / F11) TaxID=1314773 RepID=A0A3N2Q966_SODAK|nr:hypothetical protein SODALDRAFT_34841 [Sodiomyces alkalinus F11]ROT43266.1 hypothetical protein SODALDRAFT_34841 [Sodiomyces alkalinus F11]